MALKRRKRKRRQNQGQLENNKQKKSLQQDLIQKLRAPRFRQLNEELFYSKESEESVRLIAEDVTLYSNYHQGFRDQVTKWPENPAEVIVEILKRLPRDTAVGDFGCGDALIAQSLVTHFTKTLHSFDLVKTNELVTVSNSKNTPLPDQSLDIAVFSLALMGNDFYHCLMESNRVLKPNGKLIIAEVKSRFVVEQDALLSPDENMIKGITKFTRALSLIGFQPVRDKKERRDLSGKMFVILSFVKVAPCHMVAHSRNTLCEKLKSIFTFKEYKYKKR